ncbi:MAG: DEAD/DEAH box helicase, partial [Acidimicrobiales bacterium]
VTDPPVTGLPADRGFELDRFQIDAMAAIDRGESVLVAAPTGAGKTVVAEHAVARAVASGGKAFYTTPIKALSNQKFHDLVERHGSDAVGLLTGDNAINGDASIVVMTTEVLRNMIYSRSGALDGLRCVVLDEVHYLQDAYRGPVWEEVMVHLPPEVRLVCLSATVSNAAELAEWISTVRGPTTTVLETERPIELANLYMVGERGGERAVLIPTLVDGRPNPEGDRFDAVARHPGRGRPRRQWYTPRRLEVIDALRERELLPVIYFIFSRAACDDAVRACLDAGLRLTEPEERRRIRDIVEDHVAALSDDDLAVLGYDRFMAGLEAGLASHHAGMVPPFKEAVEACFVAGLVRVVFATETLALGINMPARTVVIEKLTKFTGERHEFLTPGQYTQLTGRAGRRGIDTQGFAVVLWSPFTSFGEVAGLAPSRSFTLSSAFRPTYNMAANLVRRYAADQAHHLLNLSFAQFQADQAVVRMETRLARRESALVEARAEAQCDRGDIDAYRALVAATERAPDDDGPTGSRQPRSQVELAMSRLRPGDVIQQPGRNDDSHYVVLTVARRKGGTVRLRVLTKRGRVVSLASSDFADRPEVVGKVALPVPYAPDDRGFQQEVAEELRGLPAPRRGARSARVDPDDPDAPRSRRARRASADADLAQLLAHPVDDCPDRDRHLRAARQAERIGREVADLKRQIRGRTESLARRFDQILQLLEAWGYLEGWALTARGQRLVRIFHESDLLVAEAIESGLLDGLEPAALAGLVSCFTYEHRSSAPAAAPWFPSANVEHRFVQMTQLAAELAADEEASGLPLTRPPDPGFLALAHAWVAGQPLDEILEDEELSGGDFVRNAKLLIDLLRQVAEAASDGATARSARQAADLMFRGVVSASSVVPTPET